MKLWIQISALLLVCVVSAAATNLHAAWVSDGIVVISVAGSQDVPVAVSDGAGGAFIVWKDYRTVNTDIYAQRVDADGALLWLADGMPVCTATNAQSSPMIVSDGADGAIVAWGDFRSNNVLDIYAQRINASGYGQWTGNGVAVCTGQTGVSLSQMIPDGSGGAIIAWIDQRGGTNQVFAQRINASGTVQWIANGVLACTGTGAETNPTLASDGSGGTFVAWQDNRSGLNDIYGQRIGSDGFVHWAADGVAICTAAMQQTVAQAVSDSAGCAIVAWSDYRNSADYDVYAQRIDASGTALWTAGGIAVSALASNQMSCKIAFVGSGCAVIVWNDYRAGNADVYAQKVDTTGVSQWTSNGVPVCAAANTQGACQLIPIGSEGTIVVWQDARDGTSNYQIYTQKIDADGDTEWTSNGVALCTASGNQMAPAIAADGVGGAIAAWQDSRGANVDVYAQRVDAAGHTVVATLLQSWSAAAGDGGIEIRWGLSEADPGIELFMLRAEGATGAYRELPAGSIIREELSFSYIDKECEPGAAYRYRVDVRDAGGRIVLFETGIVRTPTLPLTLYQNVPNPFNPSTTIRFFVPEPSSASIDIYDAAGSLVRRLASGRRERGMHTVSWDGRDDRGNTAGSGVYYCKLKAGKEVISRTMVLVR